MTEKKEQKKNPSTTQDPSEKIRPASEKDFAGINRAQDSKYRPATEVTNEWKAREDEKK